MQSTVAVRGRDNDSLLDAPLARDGSGRYFIPGSSLAGVMRAYALNEWGDSAALKSLFGSPDSASRLCVADSPVDVANCYLEICDHVSIDRHRGAAADRHKFDQQRWLAGTQFALYLCAEFSKDPSAAAAEKSLLTDLAQAMMAGQIRLGAKTARGQGEVELINAQTRSVKLEKHGLIEFLANGQSWASLPLAPATSKHAFVSFSVAFTAEQPLMMKAGHSGKRIDIIPRTQRHADGTHRLLLSGHAIAGVLRTRAEKIVRTLLDLQAPAKFLDQIDVPIVNTLFGAAKTRQGSKTAGVESARRALLQVADCLSVTHALSDGELATLGDSESLQVCTNGSFKPLWSVALDRWTQAPKDGALFNVLVPVAAVWSGVTLRYEVHPGVPEKLHQACVGLLLHVLADLHRGELAFGFGTRRGLGAIKVNSIDIAPSSNAPEWLKKLPEKPSDLTAETWKAIVGSDDPISAWHQETRPATSEAAHADKDNQEAA